MHFRSLIIKDESCDIVVDLTVFNVTSIVTLSVIKYRYISPENDKMSLHEYV